MIMAKILETSVPGFRTLV